jgi:methylated-DNA-[protein]-cysteine S-methyltransferase
VTSNGCDPILGELSGLASDLPYELVDRLFGSWIRLAAPLGDLYVAFTDCGISYIRTAELVAGEDAFQESFRDRFGAPLRQVTRPPTGLLAALRRPAAARKLPVDLRSLPDFDRQVLSTARLVPVGQTRPYGWIAREVGEPGAADNVAAALARNPVPVVIPCHRVLPPDGQLGDYVLGTPLKEGLLRAENVNLDEVRALARDNVFFLGSDTTHIVCFPTCAHARRITAPHRRGFADIATAARSGYRPCKHCRPGSAAPG